MDSSDSKLINVEPSDPKRVDTPALFHGLNSDDIQYLRAAAQSQGFDVPFSQYRIPGGLVRMNLHLSDRGELISLSKQALDEYNIKESTTFQFVDLEKATNQSVAGRMFYITFKAKDEDQDVQMFRTKIWKKCAKKGIEIKFCEKI